MELQQGETGRQRVVLKPSRKEVLLMLLFRGGVALMLLRRGIFAHVAQARDFRSCCSEGGRRDVDAVQCSIAALPPLFCMHAVHASLGLLRMRTTSAAAVLCNNQLCACLPAHTWSSPSMTSPNARRNERLVGSAPRVCPAAGASLPARAAACRAGSRQTGCCHAAWMRRAEQHAQAAPSR